MLCFSWAAHDAMPMPPPPCHHARRPRGDSVPSVIVLFRVDYCRIPVEFSHSQIMRYARHGASPPWSLQQRLPPAASILRFPDRTESGNLTYTGGTAHSFCYPAYQTCCVTNAGYVLVKGLAMLVFRPQHARLGCPPLMNISYGGCSHLSSHRPTRRTYCDENGPVLAVTLDYVTSPVS